jgi:hypothetical protein
MLEARVSHLEMKARTLSNLLRLVMQTHTTKTSVPRPDLPHNTLTTCRAGQMTMLQQEASRF